MGLEIFDGRPGDGKSYSAMSLKILPHLARGGYVATNIAVNPEGVRLWMLARGLIFQPDRLRYLEEHEVPVFYKHIPAGSESCNVLVVLDECHLWFNSRDWKESDGKFRQTFNLATKHRHYFLDIVLISQHFANIDGQFLRLIEKLWRFTDLKKWHMPGLPFIRIPFFRFLAVKYDKTGKSVQGREWQVFDKLVGNAYDTRDSAKKTAMSGSVEKAEIAKDPVVMAKLARIRRWIIGSVAAIVAGLAVWMAYRAGQGEKPEFVSPPPEIPRPPKKEKGLFTSAPEEKPKFPSYRDRPTKLELVKVRAVTKINGVLSLRVELDDVWQWVKAGHFTTRGRVSFIKRLSHDLYDLEISEDGHGPLKLRGWLMPVPAEGATGSLSKPAGVYGAAPAAASAALPPLGGDPFPPGESQNIPPQNTP